MQEAICGWVPLKRLAVSYAAQAAYARGRPIVVVERREVVGDRTRPVYDHLYGAYEVDEAPSFTEQATETQYIPLFIVTVNPIKEPVE